MADHDARGAGAQLTTERTDRVDEFLRPLLIVGNQGASLLKTSQFIVPFHIIQWLMFASSYALQYAHKKCFIPF